MYPIYYGLLIEYKLNIFNSLIFTTSYSYFKITYLIFLMNELVVLIFVNFVYENIENFLLYSKKPTRMKSLLFEKKS